MRRWRIVGGAMIALAVSACGRTAVMRTVATGTVGNMHITVAMPAGHVVTGANSFRVTFTNPDARPITVNNPVIALISPPAGALGGVRYDAQLIDRSVGVYEGRVAVRHDGPWNGEVSWLDGGKAVRWTFPIAEH